MLANVFPDSVVLRITQLDILKDTGAWECGYGEERSGTQELSVYSKYCLPKKQLNILIHTDGKHANNSI